MSYRAVVVMCFSGARTSMFATSLSGFWSSDLDLFCHNDDLMDSICRLCACELSRVVLLLLLLVVSTFFHCNPSFTCLLVVTVFSCFCRACFVSHGAFVACAPSRSVIALFSLHVGIRCWRTFLRILLFPCICLRSSLTTRLLLASTAWSSWY
jgi:hypothetical protein